MKKIIALNLGLINATTAYTAPHDLFLQAKNLNDKNSSTSSHITVSIDAVNDKIDLFDFRESEGVSDKSIGNYQGANIHAVYEINPRWAIEGSYFHREIDISDDSNEIQSGLFAIRYMPTLNLQKNDAIMFRGSIWGNTADVLNKTSPTQIDQLTLEQVHVQKPKDIQLQLDAIFSRKLDPMNQLNFFVSTGYSKVEVNQLNIQALRSGCLMDIQIDRNNQYKGNLVKACQLDQATIDAINIQGDANDYNLDIQKDLNYDSYYASLGGSWNLKYKKFESQVAYQYQRLWRNDIDDRVSNFGNQPIKDNHTLGVKFSYDITPKISTFVQGELYKHNFVGKIPFLYNGVTASRLDKKYGIASLGLNFKLF